MNRRAVMAPLTTRVAAMGNAYWDRVAWSWQRDAGAGRYGYDVLASSASLTLAV